MIDVLDESLRAAAFHSPAAYPTLFAAGLATGVGPCAAPRYVALAALAHAAARPLAVVGAFVAGLVGAYVAVGCCASTLALLWSASPVFYAALAAALAGGGLITLARAHAGACAPDVPARTSASAGGVLLLGASTALVVSPCCTPLIAGIAGLTLGAGHAWEGAALLAAFALGHAVAPASAALLGRRAGHIVARLGAAQAPAIVSGTLMLALAAYYAVLA